MNYTLLAIECPYFGTYSLGSFDAGLPGMIAIRLVNGGNNMTFVAFHRTWSEIFERLLITQNSSILLVLTKKEMVPEEGIEPPTKGL